MTTATPFRVILVLTLFLGMAGRVMACLWDEDTLAMEAKAFPKLPYVLTGWFDRNPPLYYEMRLKRVTEQIAAHPEDLAAYDDAGVACDRLGRDDEAVEWMERKWERMALRDANAPQTKEHRYRYHANLGTFLAHRWFKHGANLAKMDDLRAGRNHIALAIGINPSAHFGREKYQLLVMEWFLDAPRDEDGNPPALGEYILVRLSKPFKTGAVPKGNIEINYGLPNDPPSSESIRAVKSEDVNAAIKGLSGLIVLGNAWESPDVYEAIECLLIHRNDASVAHLALLRCYELERSGKRLLAPFDGLMVVGQLNMPDQQTSNMATYRLLRDKAEEAHREREEYMLVRLKAGRHPDTDPTFWKELPKRELPPLDTKWSRAQLDREIDRGWNLEPLLWWGSLGIPLGLIGLWIRRRLRIARR